jgi:hypothetical protein
MGIMVFVGRALARAAIPAWRGMNPMQHGKNQPLREFECVDGTLFHLLLGNDAFTARAEARPTLLN